MCEQSVVPTQKVPGEGALTHTVHMHKLRSLEPVNTIDAVCHVQKTAVAHYL